MNIKNIQAFLLTATVVTASATAFAHEAAPRNQYSQFRGEVQQLDTFKVTNLRGEVVKMVPSSTFRPNEIQLSRPGNSAHFSLVGNYMGQRACTVFLDNNELTNPTLSSTSNLFNLIDRQSYLYSIVAHEMSHCVGITPEDAQSFVNRSIAENPGLRNYGDQLKSLASSMREVHADLNTVLLGASKTGDWTVLDQYLIPEKMQNFNPGSSSMLAVMDMIKILDPRKLKGLGYAQVTEMSNILLKTGLYGNNGQIDITSTVAKNIMREWYATGLETKIYVKAYAPKNSATEMTIQWVELHRQMAEASMGKQELKDRTAISFIYGLKKYSLETQNGLIARSGLSNDKRGSTLLKMNQNRITNLDFIMKNTDSLHYGAPGNVDAQRIAQSQWINRHKNPQASQILASQLPLIMADALIPGQDNAYNDRLRQAERSIQGRFSQSLNAPYLDNQGTQYNQSSNYRQTTPTNRNTYQQNSYGY